MLQGRITFHRLNQTEKDAVGFNRRMFLLTSAMAGASSALMANGVKPAVAGLLSDNHKATVLQMTQDIYPHPELLSLEVYKTITDTVISSAAKQQDTENSLKDGVNRLNKLSRSLHQKDYLDVKDPDAREGLLRHFQNEGFFQNIRWTAYFGIYNNKALWPKFGYEGSSVEHGGYIDRGFSDITFVPEGPSLEQRLADAKK